MRPDRARALFWWAYMSVLALVYYYLIAHLWRD